MAIRWLFNRRKTLRVVWYNHCSLLLTKSEHAYSCRPDFSTQ